MVLHPQPSHKKSIHGNVLFLILIAVGLFAALSYAVSQSSGGGRDIDRETVILSAGQLVQYGALANSIVSNLRFAQGCLENQLSFERAPFDGSDTDYVNPNAPTDLSCHIFSPNGGGLEIVNPNTIPGLTDATTEMEFYGGTRVAGAGSSAFFLQGTPSTAVDLTLIVRNMSVEACDAINSGVGLDTTFTDNGDLNDAPFVGQYIIEDTIDGCGMDNCVDIVADSPWGSRGIQNACFIEENTGNRIYFHTLLVR